MKLSSRKIVILFVFTQALLLSLIWGCSEKPQDQAIVEVNNQPIMSSEYLARLQDAMDYYKTAGNIDFNSPENTHIKENLANAVLEQMIDLEIFLQGVKNMGFEVTPEQMKSEEEKFISSFPTTEDFDRAIQEEYRNYDDFLALLKIQLLRDMVYKSITGDVAVEEAEVKEFFDKNPQRFNQVHLRQIVVYEFDEAKKVVDLYESGATFEELVEQYSKDKATVEIGGDIGYVRSAQMFKAVADEVFFMPVNAITVIEVNHGYHIFQVLDHREANFELLKDDLTAEFLLRKKDQIFNQFFEDLKNQAVIKNLIRQA